MPIIFLAGDKANNLERVDSTPTASPGADTNFGIVRLYDRFPSSPFRFSASSSASYVQADLNVITNGGMETASTSSTGDVATWTESNSGTGAVTRTATAGEFSAGTAGMKLDAGTGSAAAYEDKEMRSGERFTVTADLRSTGAVTSVEIQIQNLETGSYLSTAGTWGSTATNALTNATSSFATVTQTATVEALTSQTRQDLVHLRVTIVNDSTGTIGYADEVYLWPSYDFSSIHGHNIDARVSAALVSSSSSGFGTTATDATFTVQQPSFFAALSTQRDKRYVRLSFTGSNSTQSGIIYIGEWVVGQKYDPTNDPLNGPTITQTDFQIRQDQNPTSARSFLLGDHETRILAFQFTHDTTSNLTEYRDHWWRRSRFGHHPLVVCPLSTGADVVYGKLDPTWTYSHETFLTVTTADVNLVELPMPTFVA